MTTATASISTDLCRFRSGEPGRYESIAFAEYLAAPIMSQSVLKAGRKSMKQLKAEFDGIGKKKPTDRMNLGSALHCCFLEPEMMPERVALWTGERRYGKDWDAFCAENENKIILTKGHHANLIGMVKALRSCPDVREWLHRIEATEVSAIGMFQDVKVKGRCDALTDDPFFELKMTSSVDDRTINSRIATFGYAIQACIYCEIFGRTSFRLGFVEDTPPHDVRVIKLGEAWMKIGRADALALTQRYKLALNLDHWPGVSEKVDTMEPPAWMLENSGVAGSITIGGESAFEEE